MKHIKMTSSYNEILDCKEIIIENQDSNKDKTTKQNLWLKLLTGILIGFVNGFCGGGGGMICVPLLSSIIKLPEKKAHATTILIMLPLCIASFIIYAVSGNINFSDAWQVGIGFVVGGIIGAVLLNVIKNVWLSLIFSVIIIYGGVKLLL